MKKILSLLSVVIIALCTFTSCDEDLMISTSLKGTWKGDMYTYRDYKGHTVKATYTEIAFFKDAGDKEGDGYWIDYFSDLPRDYYYSRIYWRVKNQDIYIDFINDHTSIVIHDYKLRDKHFTGWFKDDYNTHTNFDLIKIRDDYNDYDYYDSYSKATRSSDNSENVEIPVRRFIKQ
jgi:hypothetical protein